MTRRKVSLFALTIGKITIYGTSVKVLSLVLRFSHVPNLASILALPCARKTDVVTSDGVTERLLPRRNGRVQMKAQIKLFKIFGIQIGLHYSWLLIAVLIVFSLAGQFGATNPAWSPSVIWGLAIITAICFFASIIIHELSHAAVAKARGLPVRSITLFALGGVAQIEKEPSDARTEFWMGIAGPITSAIIGMVCLGAALFLGWSPLSNQQSPLAAMLGWLGAINLMLAIFNMVPGFPLDGGRVLRAIIWWITGNPAQAIRIASGVGQVVAFAFILLGLFRFFNGAGFAGLWLTFIGWFLLDAARSTYAQFEVMSRLRGVNVQ